MVIVTESAKKKLHEYLTVNSITSCVRVGLMQGACSGPTLGIALDDQKENDTASSCDGITIIIDKNLLLQCGEITVNYLEEDNRSNFIVTSTNPIPGKRQDGAMRNCGPNGCGG